ncbi:hypothetical protein P152DRAFT_456398 [Eremomyces bilateralis CBS 781.70]|uniref:Cytochrome b5 heme-binding domain-containing protein n=1 Tax=Eremomyces bilateralis CBS 781.70 TaxID=1392243 RepID=A0A6G1G8B2_9PEZI|nr:uncharacterized protein P152DRAFT_456398 [Eremomyces bilateralis CBS 781.70]KAF1814166.1 hypothetical protein P152DRAFT_456398 [Eremomyces bilateralis CBS 781.70]
MIVGICIILLSVSFFVYQRDPARWNRYLHPAPATDASPSSKSPSPGPADDNKEELDGRISSVGIVIEERTPDVEASESRDSTPKANATTNGIPPIPSFSLESDTASDDDYDDTDTMAPPVFPAPNSAQRASAGPIPARFRLPSSAPRAPTTSPQLMAPPPVPMRRPPVPGTAASLRVPNGPIPNRAAPTQSSLGVPLSTAVRAPNPRKKVTLEPGHSPLDWAALKRSSANLSGVSSLQRVTPSQLKQHNGRKGKPAWSAYQGKVYNVTPYVPFHPGGEGEIRRAAGKDGEKLFNEVHPWVNWDNMLESCIVGIMVGEAETLKSPLDEVD